MKSPRLPVMSCLTLGLLCSPLAALAENRPARAQVIRPTQAAAAAGAYSVEIPVVARVQGTAFFRTAIDITNNTPGDIIARYQYSYTCVSTLCNPQGRFDRTVLQSITLNGSDNFHQDDIVSYLNSLNLLDPGAFEGSIGTLLVTFENLPSICGWEASATGRIYNRVAEGDPSRGTVGFAFNGSLFAESAGSSLVATMRDTKASPTVAGMLRTNLGIRSTDIDGTGRNVTVNLEFYDAASGLRVGNRISLPNIAPGELRQVSDVWATAQIPASVTSAIAFADVDNPAATTPTIEGYVTIIDGQSTQDAAFFEMRCADPVDFGCYRRVANPPPCGPS